MSRHASTPHVTATAVPEALDALAQLVDDGDLRAARRETRRLLEDADPHTLAVLTQCAQALQAQPDVAAARLQQLWLASGAGDRAIIAACLPDPDYRPDLPTAQIDYLVRRRPRFVVPRDLRVTRGALSAPRPRQGDSAIAAAYTEERGGVDGQPERPERPAGHELDYDLAAVPALRGLPCVACWIERTRADHHHGREDGLCGECRDAARPGIPALPAGHTRADEVRARCQYIADTDTTGHGGLSTLRVEYRRANTADRAVITAWVRAHQARPSSAAG